MYIKVKHVLDINVAKDAVCQVVPVVIIKKDTIIWKKILYSHGEGEGALNWKEQITEP